MDSPAENVATLINQDDFDVLKEAVINLTKFVSSLSQDNTKLKNRISNSEARMDRIAKNQTPEPKSTKTKVEQLEAHVQSMEQMVTHLNSVSQNSSHAQQLNTYQLEQVKQQFFLMLHRSNQSMTETIKKLESAQQVDKVQFDGAMKSLKSYLQTKDSENKDSLTKIQLELEDLVEKKTKGVDNLLQQIKKQQKIDKEAKTILETRINKIENSLEAKNNAATTKRKEYSSSAESPTSSHNSASKVNPDYIHNSNFSNASSNKSQHNSGVDTMAYFDKANQFLDYFQKDNGATTIIGGVSKTTVSETKPITSWTKATECPPIVTEPGSKYTASSGKTPVKGMQQSQLPVTFGMGEYTDGMNY